MKRCPKCGNTKEATEFYPIKLKRKSGVVPGLTPYCRACSNQRTVQYQRQRYNSDPEYRARRNQQNSAHNKRRRSTDTEYAKATDRKKYQRRLERERERKEALAQLLLESGQQQLKRCTDCGRDISGRSINAKYCLDCARARRQATVRNYVARQREKS